MGWVDCMADRRTRTRGYAKWFCVPFGGVGWRVVVVGVDAPLVGEHYYW